MKSDDNAAQAAKRTVFPYEVPTLRTPVGAQNSVADSPRATPDTELVLRMARGDAPALGVLFDRWVDVLHDRAIRMGFSVGEAEAVVESTFWDAWLRAASYTSVHGHPGQWLFALLRKVSGDNSDGGAIRQTEATVDSGMTATASQSLKTGNASRP